MNTQRKQSYVNELEDLILSRYVHIYSKQSRNSIKSLSVSPQCFFIRNRKFHPQIFMESQKVQLLKLFLKRTKLEDLNFLISNPYYKATVMINFMCDSD